MLNISDRASVDLSHNSFDTDLTVQDNRQFFLPMLSSNPELNTLLRSIYNFWVSSDDYIFKSLQQYKEVSYQFLFGFILLCWSVFEHFLILRKTFSNNLFAHII